MEKKDILILLSRYRAGETLTKEEQLWLDSFYVHRAKQPGDELSEAELKKNLSYVESAIIEETSRRKSIRLWKWKYVAVAASIVFAFSTFFYFYYTNNLARENTKQQALFERITPGTDKAVLELANGKKIVLNSGENLSIDNGNIHVGGRQIILDDQSQTWSTLYTPNGGQFKIVLSDGSMVWLNAGSQLHYPDQFEGERREVELIGEAYFEVSHNPKKPFLVRTKDQQIEVLGTGFNINAYSNNKTTTTLAHGKVRVGPQHATNGHSITLKPGEQAISVGEGLQRKSADVDNVIAWKNGFFSFRKSSLQDITHELERWYDVEFVFQDKMMPAKQITGEVPRNVNLFDIVEILSYFDIDCNIQGRTVYLYIKK